MQRSLIVHQNSSSRILQKAYPETARIAQWYYRLPATFVVQGWNQLIWLYRRPCNVPVGDGGASPWNLSARSPKMPWSTRVAAQLRKFRNSRQRRTHFSQMECSWSACIGSFSVSKALPIMKVMLVATLAFRFEQQKKNWCSFCFVPHCIRRRWRARTASDTKLQTVGWKSIFVEFELQKNANK